jgi:hypothetical protein
MRSRPVDISPRVFSTDGISRSANKKNQLAITRLVLMRSTQVTRPQLVPPDARRGLPPHTYGSVARDPTTWRPRAESGNVTLINDDIRRAWRVVDLRY